MTETIPNLWPGQFKVDVQSPLTILRVQASFLGKVTRGILEAIVETETSKEEVQHRLVVIAPAFNGYRHTLLIAKHNSDLPYPAEVIADSLGKEGGYYQTVYPKASSDDEMQQLVQKVLQSAQTRALILSLIAKSNEPKPPAAVIPQNGTSDQAGPQSDQVG